VITAFADGLAEMPGLEIVDGCGAGLTAPTGTGKTLLAATMVEISARAFPLKLVGAGAGFKTALLKITLPISGGRFCAGTVASGMMFAADEVECLLASDLPEFCPLEFAGVSSCPLLPTGVGIESACLGAVACGPLGAGALAFAGAFPFAGFTTTNGGDFPGLADWMEMRVASMIATAGWPAAGGCCILRR